MHFPEGAVPKEGPSAGIAVATALLSALLQAPVLPRVALSGEITLTGQVLPVGGLKEKLLAALREGVETVVLPAAVKPEVQELPAELKKGLNIAYVENYRRRASACLPGGRGAGRKGSDVTETTMAARYAPHEVEDRLMERWLERSAFHADPRRPAAGLRHRHPSAQRHRLSAHGPRPQRHHPGHPHPLSPAARVQHPLDSGHRPRRHRDTKQGRGSVGGRRPAQRGPRPRSLRSARVEVAGRVRLHHHPPTQASGLRLRLRVGALHHGRGVPEGGRQGLRVSVREGRYLPRRLPGQLVRALRVGHLRPGSGARGPCRSSSTT